MDQRKIYIRAKGGLAHGWGHIVRANTLAEYIASSEGKYKILMSVEGDEAVRKFMSTRGVPFKYFPIGTTANEKDVVNKFAPDVVVIDMLEASEAMLSFYKEYCDKLVIFNDMGRDYPVGNVIISPQFLQSYPKKYIGQKHLNGPDYFILSKSILEAKVNAGMREFSHIAKSLLVIMGGCISNKVFKELIKVIEDILGINIKITFIVGYDSDVNLDSYHYLRQRGVTFVEETDNVGRFMAEADLALASSGYVKYELATLGTPALLVSVVDHQEILGTVFAQKSGAAEYIGNILNIELKEIVCAVKHLILNKSKRKEMSEAGMCLMDGSALLRIERELVS